MAWIAVEVTASEPRSTLPESQCARRLVPVASRGGEIDRSRFQRTRMNRQRRKDGGAGQP
jgi:hypothetical protein